jgi:hypothetical protein
MDKPEIVIAATNFDLARALSGHPMTVRTLDGKPAVVRLATPDELLTFHAEACAKIAPGAPEMTRAQAEKLTAPLPI